MSIRVACPAVNVSEVFYRYVGKHKAENDEIAYWLIRGYYFFHAEMLSMYVWCFVSESTVFLRVATVAYDPRARPETK